jgi:hypothetical protein
MDMAKKDDLWLVTHRVTAERLTPKKEESGFAYLLWLGIILFLVWIYFGGGQ